MNKLLLSLSAAIILSLTGCGGSGSTTTSGNTSANQPTKTTASENKPTEKTTSTTATTGAASAVVKDIYDNAMKKNCKAIPPMLTEEFRKAVGTSEGELEALCDTFTDSGKLTSFEVKGETLNGDSGKVKVALTFKDGKTEDKEENVKKSGDKWLMDS